MPKQTVEIVNFTINGREGRAPAGTLVITAAERMGIFIPRFCHHEKLMPYGGCRMCMIDIDGADKLQTACTVPVRDGLVAYTNSDRVTRARHANLEFLLINHPLDCPICDKGGECPLQDQYYEFSSELSRFKEKKLFRRNAPLNSTIQQDFNRCVLCKRCVRFSYEIATDDLIVYEKRAVHTSVTSFYRKPYESVYSGNIIELCPVGALTDSVFRFKCRPWELNHTKSICVGCSQNCHIDLQHRSGELHRIFARDFEPINDSWICDKGRFNHQFLKSENRIRQPLEKVNGEFKPIDWRRAYDLIVSNIQKTLDESGPGSIGAVIENDHTLEEFSAFRKLMWEIIKTPNFDTYPSLKGLRTEKSGYFLRNLPTFEQVAGSNAILNIGCDLVSELPMLALKIRRNIMYSHRIVFNLVTIPTETGKLMPEFCIPLDQYAGAIAEIARRISMHEKIDDLTRGRILSALRDVPPPTDTTIASVISDISELVKTSKVALVIGNWILKTDSVYLGISKILIELFEKLQQIPVIMPVFRGGNAVGAEMMRIHPMLPSIGAKGEMELAGGQGSEDMMRAALSGKIKTLLVFSNKFGISLPEYEWKKGVEKVDYMIWADYFHSPLNDSADLLLPLLSPYEKNGHVVNNEGRFDTLKRAIRPKGQIKSTLEIIEKIAGGLNGEIDFSSSTLLKEIMQDPRFGPQLSYGGFVYVDTKRGFLEKPEIRKPRQTDSTNPYIMIPTTPFWSGDETILNSPDVSGRLLEFFCIMNESDAGDRNLKDGQHVQVSTEHGKLKAVLRLSSRMPRGYISIPEGYINSMIGHLIVSEKTIFSVKVGPVFSQ
jgi:NADH-quinone oxidoreductase subunit G